MPAWARWKIIMWGTAGFGSITMTWPNVDYRAQRPWMVRRLLGIWSRRLETRPHLMWTTVGNWSPHLSPTQSKRFWLITENSPPGRPWRCLRRSISSRSFRYVFKWIFLNFIACSSKSCVLCDSCRSRRPKSPSSTCGQPSSNTHSRRRSTFTTELEGKCSTMSALIRKGSTKMDSRTLHVR